jgi:hypothetical protein
LRKDYRYDSTVDVFFIHPTTLISTDNENWNASLLDQELNDKTDMTTILFQASVFNEYAVYAPRYRQAHLRSYYTTDTLSALQALQFAYTDIREAFQYYLDHFNHGHPIIIASHSQGSTHAQWLLKEFFDGKALRHQLVAAYIVGMHIPADEFSSIPACKDSSQTGCYASWRTFKTGYVAPFVRKELNNAPVTNPLSWKISNEYISRKNNPGAVLRKFNKVLPFVSDAQVHEGILWVHRPNFPGSFLYRTKNYHIGDINLFYLSIRNNLRVRTAAFQQKREKQ